MKATLEQVKIGTKLSACNLIMIVTGENEKRFTGYSEYKGKNAGACSIEKSMFSNPHYMNSIKIID